MLVYALGPRPQCLQQLTERDVFATGMRERPRVPSIFPPGDPLNSSATEYLLQLPPEAVKNGNPWYVWLPAFMTRHLDFWRANYTKPGDAWLFLNEQGKQQRTGAARWTRKVTESIIGRPIIAHRFRHAIVTFFDGQGLDEDERVYLAAVYDAQRGHGSDALPRRQGEGARVLGAVSGGAGPGRCGCPRLVTAGAEPVARPPAV